MRGEWTAAAYAALYDRVVDDFAPDPLRWAFIGMD